jgi:gliding motility-associated-like protein
MKRHLLHFLYLGVLLFSAGKVSGQLVGTNCYVQGRYLDIGMTPNASFGACNAQGPIPPTYHVHAFAGAPPTGSNLAETYDYGHDGWTVGAPVFMGDYTYPGSPFEGWAIQVGASRAQAFQSCTIITTGTAGGGTLAGSHTGYSNFAGRATGTWTGTYTGGGATLAIRQETRVDTLASAVVVTTVLRNTGAAATAPVYYQRTCDPDNDQTWPGGGFFTFNTIIHQNEDARHRVLVASRGNTGANSYMSLGTKDCRARCCIYDSWPMSSATDLATVWNGTNPGSTHNLGGTRDNDIAISLVYNLGSIPSGDSTILSYAYIFNGNLGIDSAFPDPQIRINGVPKLSWAPPQPNYDTFIACESGLTSIPVDILNATDKGWSWSRWTWAPSTGLATTTGVTNTITFAGLPPVITYTITGTDSATGMYSCHNKTFYLTIISCNGATANNPCVGDTLFLNAPGDSLGATYQWYGPAPSTTVFATTQAYSIFPATLAHSGTYSVIKTVMGIPDTSDVTVTVYDLPRTTNLTSTQPDCAPVVDPVTITLSIDSVTTSWAWTGPGGFTSSVQSPTFAFDSSMQGKFYVTFVSNHGCVGRDSIILKPGPVADFTTQAFPQCPKDSVAVTNLSVHGATFEWDYGDGSKSFDKFPSKHAYTYVPPGTNRTIILKVTSQNGCQAIKTVVTDTRHDVKADFDFADDTICNTPATPVVITDLSTSSRFGTALPALYSHSWQYSSGHTDNTNGSPDPSYVFPEEGFYQVTLNIVDSMNCESSVTKGIYVLQPYIKSISDSTFCLTMPMKLWVKIDPCDNCDPNQDFNYLWTPATALSKNDIKEPEFTGVGSFTYTLTATMQHEGCVATHVMNLNSTLPKQVLNVTGDTKINYGESIQLYADNTLYYTWWPNDGSLNNPNINNPVATPTVTTTYTVYGMDFYGCRDSATVTIVVDSTADEFIPTGFTPNGDGLNDVFRLKGSKFHNMVEFRVYNRYGEQVFYSNTLNNGWDGTWNGKPADMGVYHYTVIVARPGHDHNQVIKGDVTLIR